MTTAAIEKRNPNAQSIEVTHELKSLKKLIISRHENCELLKRSAQDKAYQALAEAILTGEALDKVRKLLPPRKFNPWLQENISGPISRATAYRYLKLYSEMGASVSDLRQLPYTNKHRAYLALGMLSEPIEAVPQQHNVIDIEVVPPTDTKPEPLVPTESPVKISLQRLHSLEYLLLKPKFLINSLLLDLLNKYKYDSVSLDMLEEHTLKPLAAWFAEQRAKTHDSAA